MTTSDRDSNSLGQPSLEAAHAAAPAAAPRSRVWLWVLVAFLLQFGAWGAWFTIAAKHKVQEVPLAGSTRR